MELQTKQSESLINDNTTTCVVVEEDENINSSYVKTSAENETNPQVQTSIEKKRNSVGEISGEVELLKINEEGLKESKLSVVTAKGADVEESLSKIETGIVQSDKTIFNDIEMQASSQPSVQMLSETINKTNIITDESVSDETGFQKISFDGNQENIIVSSSKKVMEKGNIEPVTCESNSNSNHVEVKVEIIDNEQKKEIDETSEVVIKDAEESAKLAQEAVKENASSSPEPKIPEELGSSESSSKKENLLQIESSNSSEKLNESYNTTSDDSKVHKNVNSAGDDSEYETLEEDNMEEERPEEYGSDSEVGEEEEEEDGVGSDNRERSGSSSPEIVMNEERQAADGQESDKKERKLDHDEDRRDPQYIPKKGMFYEHDDRTADGEEQKKDASRDSKKGKVWDSKETWSHDLYIESEQSMKSTDEIVAIYGYDIRKDDGPPKARRRRRYVKGPNKYERNWEDEQAYVKSSIRGGFRGGVRRGRGFGRIHSIGGGAVAHVQKEFEYKPSDFPVPQPKKSSQRYASPPKEESWDPTTLKSQRSPQPPPLQQNHMQHPNNKGHTPFHRTPQRTAQQSSTDNLNIGGKPISPKNQFHPIRRDESRNEENKVMSGKHGDHPQFQIPQGQPSQRGRGRGRLGASRPPGKNVGFSEMSNERPRMNSQDKSTSQFNPGQSTADEDIAMLAQHFSQAVINIDNKNIIRTTTSSPVVTQSSKPLTLTQVVQQHQQQQLQRQQQQQQQQQHQQQQMQNSSGTAHGERYKMDEQTGVDKGEQQRSKRYSTQRQRALPSIQHGQVGGPSNGPNNQPQQQQQQPQNVVPQGMPPPPQHVPPPPTYMHQQPPPPPTAYYHTGCVESDVVAAGQVQPVEVVTFLQPPPALHYVQPQFIQTPTGPIAMQTPPPPAGPEMFQGGGITYYNTLSQMTQGRPSCGASRRLKVAIPIVAPPQDQQQQTAGGSGNSHVA